MKRVVITGVGAATPIGNTATTTEREALQSVLLRGEVGIAYDDEFAAAGFKSVCSGRVKGLAQWRETLIAADPDGFKVTKRFLGKGDTLSLALLPALSAVEDAGLKQAVFENPEVAVFVGTGGPSTRDQVEAGIILRDCADPRKVGPFAVTPTMSSGASAIISTHLKNRGGAISLTSACATGTHNIAFAFEQIALGKRKVAIAGGADDREATKAVGFEAMRKALFSGDKFPPEKASCPFDRDRGGFVDADGGGVLILEELEHARARGAFIYAEIVGTAYSSDGADMVAPSGIGAVAAMREALKMAGNPPIQYVNAHGTSTPEGDPIEMWALNEVFGADKPYVTSSKAQVGHSLGGAGGVELIFTIWMMQTKQIVRQVNLENLDPRIEELGWVDFIPRENISCDIEYAMSNSFGFGGTNGVIVLKRFED